jgi:hypothetical protein
MRRQNPFFLQWYCIWLGQPVGGVKKQPKKNERRDSAHLAVRLSFTLVPHRSLHSKWGSRQAPPAARNAISLQIRLPASASLMRVSDSVTPAGRLAWHLFCVRTLQASPAMHQQLISNW